MTNSINELESAEVIFVIGSNTSEAHPQIARRIIAALDRGAKLIVADPRRTLMARLAHIHLPLRPGSDIPLLNVMMKIILDEHLIDDAFIEMRTENFNSLRDSLYRMDTKELVAITGLPLELIAKAARLYARAYRGVICYCLGITQHICGTDNVQSLANLAMITGHVEQEFTGVNPLRGQNNVQGACDMGALPGVFPGYQPVADAEIRAKFERAWKTDLPHNPGLTVTDMTHGGLENGIKAMFIIGENPILSDPDATQVTRTLSSLDLLVVSDIFLTETASLAHVVFPACSFAEKSGTFTNSERRVQLIRKAIEPLGQSKPDSWIICQLAKRMGYEMNYENSGEIMEEIALLTPIYGGIFHDRLEDSWGLQWPCYSRSHPGTPYLHKYSFTRGRGHFVPATHVPPAEMPDERFPYIFITGRSYYHYHTGAMTRASALLSREEPWPLVQVNPEDAKRLGLRPGDPVIVRSRRGKVQLRVEITDSVPTGIIYSNFHFTEARVNDLTSAVLDPVAKCPEYKVCAVTMEKVS